MEEPNSPAPNTAANRAPKSGGVKDTIESILIAFILAFVFRAFVVEAFVIPTGSMAPTLLGAHMNFRCADCGYEFTVNYSGRNSDDDDVNIPRFAEYWEPSRDETGRARKDMAGNIIWIHRSKTFGIYCPNCGYRIGDEELADPNHDLGSPPRVVTNPPVHYGDRILVLKYQYLLQSPQRWDVVVFKSPTDYPKYAQNYIKRLVGRPGETIMILDGDVYVSKSPGSEIDSFQIQTKPRVVQDALWRIVYDNDYHPRELSRTAGPKWTQPWTADTGSGWNLKSRQFIFNNATGDGLIRFNSKANPNQHALTDWLAYDATMNQTETADTLETPIMGADNKVSDLKLDFFYDRTVGDGPLRLKMTKLDHAFFAEIGSDSARLFQQIGDGSLQQVGQTTKLPSHRHDIHIELTNVDYQVTLRIDDVDVIRTTPQEYHPDVQSLLRSFSDEKTSHEPTVEISASRQNCTLSHVSLWRDIYYINHDSRNRLQWAVPDQFPRKLVHLANQPGREEYFVLGDNSIISGDAHYWQRPIEIPDEDLSVESGRVPARFMLGKAFFVYWPAGFRPFGNSPGIVPNFGEMRFIH